MGDGVGGIEGGGMGGGEGGGVGGSMGYGVGGSEGGGVWVVVREVVFGRWCVGGEGGSVEVVWEIVCGWCRR